MTIFVVVVIVSLFVLLFGIELLVPLFLFPGIIFSILRLFFLPFQETALISVMS